jgi:hypothetical protein
MKPATLKKTDPKKGLTLIEMTLDVEWKGIWAETLRDLQVPGSEEVLRAYSPTDGIIWTLYFKLAEEGIPGKALLAHPEEDQYVATLRVTKTQRDEWLAKLEQPDLQNYRLSSAGPFMTPSNLDVEWKLQ